MSFAAYKMMQWPTGVDNCASGYLTHSRSDFTPRIPSLQPDDDLDSDWVSQPPDLAPVPNLVITAANILEVYIVRLQHDPPKSSSSDSRVLDGIAGASLELVCHYRLHGNVESVAVLSVGGGDASRRRDSIILTFKDAKISVLEYDDSIHGLRTSSLHCFEGPEWLHLKRGREQFAIGPVAKVDPQGSESSVVQQFLICQFSGFGRRKDEKAGSGLVGEDDVSGSGGSVAARIDSSYMINLRDLDMRHVKDFTFVHGYIEPVMVILHERELTWAGRVSWKNHTCTISALSISTTLKQHPLIWSAVNLPHDAYKLLAVPSPIGGVLVIGANTIHYHSQSASCALALNSYAVSLDNSQEMPRSSFNVELDAANATWLVNDVALLSTKTGELLLLTLIYDGR
ncbi:cleavage and polyadenylation specificity factor subunit 1-like protein [Trifolium pratense]|uniref:Cleavage and polyadenylation specificity factor subunit 1-like protein n=1 Tax=Trifolium pratense TaxID=57577 RepID=A0A2K3P2G3_TRIPR|nr:cleavage and polyadenylation specificity factor subunit 1-like protein [Trifolium pratense]